VMNISLLFRLNLFNETIYIPNFRERFFEDDTKIPYKFSCAISGIEL